MRKTASDGYSRFGQWMDRYPGLILIAVGVATACVATGLPRIQFARSIDEADLPETSEMLRSLRKVSTLFGDDSRRVFVTLSAPAGEHITSPDALHLISTLTEEIRQLPFVKPATLLSLTHVKQVVTRDGDLAVEPVVQGKTQDTIERAIRSNPFIYGQLISKDLSTTLIIAPTQGDAEITRIHREFARITESHQSQFPKIKIGLLGDPEILYQLNKSIEKDIIVFVGLSVLLTLIAFFLVFGTWQGVVQPLVVVLTSIVWTMGCIGFYGEPITLVSATLPVVMVIIGGSYAVHVYHHLLEEQRHASGFAHSVALLFRSQASPLFMAMITTFLGGLSLLTFKIKPLQHFGLFTAWGSFISLVLAALLVPALHRLLGAGARRTVGAHHPHSIESLLTRTTRVATRHPRTVLLVSLFVLALSGVYLLKVRIGFDAVAVFPSDHPVRRTAEAMDRAFGGSRNFEIAIDSGRSEGAATADFQDRLRRFEEDCRKLPIVTRTFSVAHLIDETHRTLAPASTSGSNPTSEQVSQVLAVLSLFDSAFPLRNLITSDARSVKVSLTLNSTRTADYQVAHDQIAQILRATFGPQTEFWIGGRPMFSVAMQRYLVWGKIQNVFSTILTLIVLLLLRYRSISRSLVTAIPLGVAVVTTFGLMGLLEIQLDYITAIITSFAMGMGSDFAIHLVSSVRKQIKETPDIARACELAVSGPGKVILYNAGCTILGFSVMIFSRFTAIRVFSLLICFNMAILLLFTLWIVPAIFTLYRPAFAYRYNRIAVSWTEVALGTLVMGGLLVAGLLTERLF